MLKFLLYFLLLFGLEVVYGDAVIFSGSDVKALKYNLDLFGRSKVMALTADPSAGGGQAAPLASIGMNYSTGKVYVKTGAPDTSWQEIQTGSIDLTTDVTGILPIANGGTNNSSAYTAGSVLFSNGTSVTQDNANLFWDDAANSLNLGAAVPIKIGTTFEFNTLDSLSRTQIWNHGTSSILRLGSSQVDGDTTDAATEGIIAYDGNLGGTQNSTNVGYARVKHNRFGLYSLTAAGGDGYYFRVDPTSLYLTDNSIVKTFEVARTTGNAYTTGTLGVGLTTPTSTLQCTSAGAKTAAWTGQLLSTTATSSTASIAKIGLDVQSTGTWNGASATNTGLKVNATGGTTNYAATFEGGNVGIGTTTPTQTLDVVGSINIPTGQKYLFNSLPIAMAVTASNNWFFGNAGNLTGSGTGNTAVGDGAFDSFTTGVSNTAVGYQALTASTTANQNTAVGYQALKSLSTPGSDNVAVGYLAGQSVTTGDKNTLIGDQVAQNITTGDDNTAVGFQAMNANTAGVQNVAIGDKALLNYNSTTAVGTNTAVGYNTGLGITTGTANTIIGANVTGLATTLSNNIILADGAGNQRLNIDSTGSVGMGTTAPAASSMLEVVSTTKGVLDPRMTQAQRNAISSPATGLRVYNTDTNRNDFYNGTAWFEVGNPMTTGGDIIYGGSSGTATRLANGTAGQVLTSNGTTTAPSWATNPSAPNSSYEISNLGIATSVGSSALTITLKQADGSTDPAPGSAVKVGMRSSTLTSGLYNQRTATAATSMVISSGSTMGQTDNKPWSMYIYLLDNAGTLELAASGSLFHENQVITTTAEGGAGAADSVTVMYSTTARTSVPFRLIGKLTNTQTTAGTWASAGTNLQVGNFSALTAFTGPTVQKFTSGSGTYYTPANVKYIKIRMVGGGGGGSGSGTSAGTAAGAGGNTTFGTSLLTANGGALGSFSGVGGTGGTGTINSPAVGTVLPGGSGGPAGFNLTSGIYVTAANGGNSAFGGGGSGGNPATAGQAGSDNTGGGGGGGGIAAVANCYSGSGGGAGAYVDAIISTPLTSYAYAVGGSGAAGGNGPSGALGGAGAAGYIEVTEFY